MMRTSAEPVVFVIEDLHWADDATLDLVTFLGRRIAVASTLLVLTYRTDEIGADAPAPRRAGRGGGARAHS